MKPVIERLGRGGGGRCLVVQFLQRMWDRSSELRNLWEIPWILRENDTRTKYFVWVGFWEVFLRKKWILESAQNRLFHILAQFWTLLTWNLIFLIRPSQARESQLFKAVKIFEIDPLVQKLYLFLWRQCVSSLPSPPRPIIPITGFIYPSQVV